MAPNLALSQHNLIHDMILDGNLRTIEMAKAAGCSKTSISHIQLNICYFGSARAPWNGGGRRPSITPPMLDALREHLLEKPELYQDEMIVFLWTSSVFLSRDIVLIELWKLLAGLKKNDSANCKGAERWPPRLLLLYAIAVPLILTCVCRRIWIW